MKLLLFGFLTLLASGTRLSAQMSVSVSPSVQSPAPHGTLVTWTATVSDANPGSLRYRFRTRRSGDDFHTVVDYGPKSSLDWSVIDREGAYEIEVSAKNTDTGETAGASAMFEWTRLVTSRTPVVTPTAHPLVFIYSAPGCRLEGRMKVQFWSSDGAVQSTPYKPCDPGYSMNFYLAGLRADTEYSARYILDTGRSFVSSASVTFKTSGISLQPPSVSMLTGAKVPSVDGILLQSLFFTNSIATDLNGNVVWYSPGDITFLTRPQTGGTFLGIGVDGKKDTSQQFVREFDLAGMTLAETNAERVNEQLVALGIHPINGFHHEARKLPDGKYLVLADSERILTDVQGSGPVDVIGDTILALDPDLQVVWAWGSFDHLDPHRTALLGETCTYPAGLGCAPFYLNPNANDWLHGNSVQLTPDGNILYSARHQDWLIKIDYRNGAGSGNIIWRLGNGGDFQIVSPDPSPWFSHQHDANFEQDDASLMLFDNGNSRAASDSTIHSRGQLLKIDEQNRVATLLLNADLGTYSSAVGSAQRLPNRDYHFDAGFIYVTDPSGNVNTISQSLEVKPSGDIVFGIQFGTAAYRSFRMRDLYTAP